jgi:predicted nucleic acid-binding protein
MIIVCDTGPLTHLWQVDLWPAFEVFDETHLPVQVANEVQQHVDLDQLKHFTRLQIHTVSPIQIETAKQAQPQDVRLQFTDLAVLALAQMLTHDLVLTDDLDLRRTLEGQRFRPMGSVGVLVHAYKTHLIDRDQLDQAIEKLFTQSTLYLSPQFKSYVRQLIAAQFDNPA